MGDRVDRFKYFAIGIFLFVFGINMGRAQNNSVGRILLPAPVIYEVASYKSWLADVSSSVTEAKYVQLSIIRVEPRNCENQGGDLCVNVRLKIALFMDEKCKKPVVANRRVNVSVSINCEDAVSYGTSDQNIPSGSNFVEFDHKAIISNDRLLKFGFTPSFNPGLSFNRDDLCKLIVGTPIISESPANNFCTTGSIKLSSSVLGDSYEWTNSGGKIVGREKEIEVGVSDTYTVEVSQGECSSVSEGKQITVNPLPTKPSIETGGKPTSFCAGGSVTLSASEGWSYLWNNGSTAREILVSRSGSFSVTVTNSSGCSSTSSMTRVTVDALPSATINASGPTRFCAGGSVTLSASEGWSYLWSTGEKTQSIRVTNSGRFTVIVTNENKCSATSVALAVTVTSFLKPIIMGSSHLCAGESTVLSADGSQAGDTFQWSNSNKVITGATQRTYTVTESGVYSVKTMRGGCSAVSVSKKVSVHTLQIPIIHHDGPVLRTNAHADHYYQWYLNGHKIEGATSIIHELNQVGAYTVMVTNHQGCSAVSAPYAVSTRDIPTLDGEFMVYPNPNDGHFQIKKPTGVQLSELRVYDMLGRIHYRSNTKQTEVNLHGLAGGMYVLEIITEPKKGYVLSRTKKFIVK